VVQVSPLGQFLLRETGAFAVCANRLAHDSAIVEPLRHSLSRKQERPFLSTQHTGYYLCLRIRAFLTIYRERVRGDFKPAAFDPHFEDGKLVAFELFAARRLIGFWIV
jgi:hypothetical protein